MHSTSKLQAINSQSSASFGGHSPRAFPVQTPAGTPLPKWRSDNSAASSGSITTPAHSRPVSFSSRRCSEKGCVFPASSAGSGACEYHERQRVEPALFHSQQPSNLLLDRAKFGPVDVEQDETRRQERRRMAILWEQFQTEECG